MYLADPDAVELLPGAAAGLRTMQRLGLGLVLITNQSGIGRGYFSEERLGQVHERLRRLLADEGIVLDGIYYCPHAPADDCPCRKPRPGLLLRAATEVEFRPADSFVIGDKRCDLELGRAVGATTLLVRTGYGAEVESAGPAAAADWIVDDLSAAAAVIERSV